MNIPLMVWLRRSKRIALFTVLVGIILLTFAASLQTVGAESKAAVNNPGPAVFVIPLKGDVKPVMHSFLKRAVNEAEKARAEQIILVINTYGGRTDSANDIGELLRSIDIPTTAFIEGKAVSAGTYIALNAKQIVMQPGSSIGSAAVVDSFGNLIDNPKTISFWVDQMQEAAKLHGRDTNIAAAMVDPRIVIDLTDSLGKIKGEGDVIALSATDALKVGYAEHNANTVEEVIQWLNLEEREVITIERSFAERLSGFITHPVVSTLLLVLGFAGIVIELIIPGFGAPGIIGIVSIGLYFFGSYISGLAGAESALLFIFGLILFIIELIVPAFGILGLLGGGAIITGIMLAAADWKSGLISILVALVIATIIVVLFSRTQKGRGVWNKFILKENLTTEEGFSSADTKESLVGATGMSLTQLRPAGTALIGDSRMDVVTECAFVEANRPLVVVKAEGTWIVVREAKES